MSKSKRKGWQGEREIVDLFPGSRRQPMSGAIKGYEGDVVLPNEEKVEVKRRKESYKEIYKWLDQQDPNYVMFRNDRSEWVVMMKMPQFKKLWEAYNGKD